MNVNNLIQISLYILVLLLLGKPLGSLMAHIYQGEIPAAFRWMKPLEKITYRLCGIRSDEEMTWKTYAIALISFSALSLVVVYVLQRIQWLLPLNPAGMKAVSPESSLNTSISFVSNTNWQGYGGETTMSYLTQMLGLTVQNFVSAAAGMAIVVALIRGFTRSLSNTIGNFWVDLTRSVVYILLPLSFVMALVLVSQGALQTFKGPVEAKVLDPFQTSEGKTVHQQTIARGPVASQVAIKQLGTNGGGFFNANSAHPFENPTVLSNFVEMIAINLIGVAFCFTFGILVGNRREGLAILAAMTLIFVPFLLFCASQEQEGNPQLSDGIDQRAASTQPGGNMEGKEARFGIVSSVIWATATTAASNGSVNSMHDSYTPLGGLVPMFMMQTGEVVYGGVGSGLYGMVLYVLIAVFVAGLMVGRTPEYLRKKIEAYEMKMASFAILVPAFLVLVGTAIAVALPAGKSSVFNPGPHGFSEILYGLSSAGNNNGSAFAGLSANTLFYNVVLGIAMFASRFWIAIPVLTIAGSLASKKFVAPGAGTLATDSLLFVLFLVGIVLMVGALTFVPALALGPVVEHLMMWKEI